MKQPSVIDLPKRAPLGILISSVYKLQCKYIIL